MKSLFTITAWVTTFLLFLITGCKKTDTPEKEIELNGVYKASSIAGISAPVMYTMDGQITDQNIIKSYLDKHSFNAYFKFNAASETLTNNDMQVNFKDTKATVSQVYIDSTYISDFDITNKSSSGFILVAADTLSQWVLLADAYNSRWLAERINKINYYSNCFPIPLSTGYNYNCTYRNKMPFLINADNIYLSLLSYAITTYSSGGANWSYNLAANTPGIFNNEIVSKMRLGDTIVVQTKTLPFNKQL